MKQQTPTVQARLRDRTGSRYARRLRKAGRLPAVIYGHQRDPISVSVDEKEIIGLIRHGAHAMYVEVEGQGRETCLVRDLQYGYLGDNVIHVDFSRVALDEEVTVRVHIDFVGTPHEAQRADAILRHDQTELTVSAKVTDIPEEIHVDLSHMEGTQLAAREIALPAGVVLAEDPETLIASVQFLRAVAEAVGEEAEVETESAEPEVITESRDEGQSAETGVESK